MLFYAYYKTMNKAKYLTTKEQRALEEFKKRILEEFNDRIFDILLFGSKARGDIKENSDIDVLVIIKSESHKDSKKVSDIAFDIVLEYGVLLSEIVIPESRWHKHLKLPTSFSFNIQKEAVKL